MPLKTYSYHYNTVDMTPLKDILVMDRSCDDRMIAEGFHYFNSSLRRSYNLTLAFIMRMRSYMLVNKHVSYNIEHVYVLDFILKQNNIFVLKSSP